MFFTRKIIFGFLHKAPANFQKFLTMLYTKKSAKSN